VVSARVAVSTQRAVRPDVVIMSAILQAVPSSWERLAAQIRERSGGGSVTYLTYFASPNGVAVTTRFFS